MHEPIVRFNRRENGMIGRRSEGYEERVGKKEEKERERRRGKRQIKQRKAIQMTHCRDRKPLID